MLKRCSKCGILKDVDEFYKDKSRKDDLDSYCKKCVSIYQKKYYRENPEKIKIRDKKYYRENSEKISINKKKYYKENKTNIRIAHNIYKKNKRKQDPLWKLRKNISRSLFYYLKQVKSSKNGESTLKLLNITKEEFNDHFNKFFNQPCEVCGIIITSTNSQIDHIKPISLATNKKEIIQLNQLNNLRLICAKCNLEKGSKYQCH